MSVPQKIFRRADPANFCNIPQELRDLPQWECWKIHEGRKKPVDPHTGDVYPKGKFTSEQMGTATFEEAVTCFMANTELLGVGFRFKKSDPYTGVDWDKCRDPETGDLAEWAQESLAEFRRTYCEVSPSGTGAHAICRARIPKAVTKQEGPGIEMYFDGRFFALTGHLLDGSPSVVAVAQPQVTDLFTQLTVNPANGHGGSKPNGTGKIPHGKIDNWLTSRAGSYRRRGDSADIIEKKLLIDYRERCAPPLDNERRVREIARGITRYEPGLDGDWPEVAETLELFNKRFYVTENLGGKCRVCSEEPSAIFPNSFSFTHQSFADFRNRFNHQRIEIGEDEKGRPVYQSRGSAWLSHKDRRQYNEVVYAPEVKLPENVRNLWRGFAFKAEKGDCSLYLAHLRENVCQGKQDRYDWMIGWMAYAVRNPNEPGHTAPVLMGCQGWGKNSAADHFAHLWGSHFLIITQRSQFTGHFNAHLRACSVLVVNEAFFAGDRSQAGPMKGLITDEFLSIEAKGIDVERARNLLHVIICSNEDWVVPADMDSRRFTVFRVSDLHKQDTVYFGKLHQQMQNGGYGALLYHLLHEVDITKFDPRKILPTEELNEQKAHSLYGVESVWHECLQRGCLPGKIEDDDTAILKAADLVDWAAKKHLRSWDSLRTEHVGHLFGANARAKKKGMEFQKLQVDDDVFNAGRVRVWKIPKLIEARKAWDQKRFVVDWGDDAEGEWKIDRDWANEQQAQQWRSNAGVSGQPKKISRKKNEAKS